MPRSGPRKVGRYTDEFKLTAVRLSEQPGIQVQTVAAALEIHPWAATRPHSHMKAFLSGAVLLLACSSGDSGHASSTAPAAAVAFVQRFYDWYLPLGNGPTVV